MTDKKKVDVPAAPKHLPEDLKKKWGEVYEKAHLQAQEDFPDDGFRHQEAALKEANRLLRIEPPKSHDDALKLRDHEVAKHEVGFVDGQGNYVNDGVARVVTSDGKKYKFPAPSSSPRFPRKAGAAEPAKKSA